ncbi:MAG TPA: hypothetical protein DCL61_27985 [Cyanobacteria bacterium UBA12227]|nr:hypothetical protein [Cyanobacteria bacterium UBA12227]HAX85920.1 hypothetical protein [Cyanobacteria bacterium UBA11370]HBY81308.1 hypothetical protein [Cyanobacteria bacterium UBA11148]
MLWFSLITLVIALVAIYLTVNILEEVVQVAAVITALICLFLSFVFAPWLVKLMIVVVLLVSFEHHQAQVPPYNS